MSSSEQADRLIACVLLAQAQFAVLTNRVTTDPH